MNKPTKKMLEAAKQYLYAEARFVAWDNHDDMDEASCWEHTFNFLVDDEISIEEFIKTYLPDEVEAAKADAITGYEDQYEDFFDIFDERFV
jgi:hypothetical protein